MKQEGKHHQKMCGNPHNRADLELTNSLKRTKPMQERTCGPAGVRRQHGGNSRPRRGESSAAALLLRRRRDLAVLKPYAASTRGKKRKGGVGRGAVAWRRREESPACPTHSRGGAAVGSPTCRGQEEPGGAAAGAEAVRQ